jgi:hypothetical protein
LLKIPGEKNNPGFLDLRIFGMWEGGEHQKGSMVLKESRQRQFNQNSMAGFKVTILVIRTLSNRERGETF